MPREKSNPDRDKGPLLQQKKIRFSFIYVLIALLLLWFFHSLTSVGPKTVAYSDFKQMLAKGELAEVWVGETEVYGLTKKKAAQQQPGAGEVAKPPAGETARPPADGQPPGAQYGQPAPPPADGQPRAAPGAGQESPGALPFGSSSEPTFRPDIKAVRVQDDEQLLELLEKSDTTYWGRVEQPGLLASILSWVLPIGLMLLFWFWIMRRMGQAGQGVMAFGKSKLKVHGEADVTTRFQDVAGVDEAKEELIEVVNYLADPARYGRLGARIPKGVLLVGPPGTGKTLLARAVAGEARVPFFTISGSDFVEMFVGVGAARVRDLFEQAQRNAPCIVFIDELDALGKTRGAGGHIGGNDEREQTLNQLLVQMDGFDPTTGVVILAATNRPEFLDPALLRPGRFDRQVLVDRPDRAGRKAILEVHARKIVLGPDVDLDRVAGRTPGFVGADLANLLNEAALLAARRNGLEVTEADLEHAIDRIVAGLEKKNRLINPREKKVVAYHEVGHAVVSSCVPGADPVQKVSIVPRGLGALGLTWQTPTEDRYLMTVSEMEGKIAALLGGRAAELVFFGEPSTGAANDLARATEAARAMVVEYGMSEAIGPVRLRPERRSFLSGMDLGEHGEYGDHVADVIDAEVRRVLDQQLERARAIVVAHRDHVDELARLLLERETISGDEVRRVCGFPARISAEENGEGRSGVVVAEVEGNSHVLPEPEGGRPVEPAAEEQGEAEEQEEQEPRARGLGGR